MTYEETVVEKAFLSALKKHFPKPGLWLPTQNIAAAGQWPSAAGIPEGQVWEVYLSEDVGGVFLLNGIALELMPAGYEWVWAGLWRPLNMNVSAYWDGAAEVVVFSGNTQTQGWILTQGDIIENGIPTIPFKVRARRRFDLE